MLNCGGSVAAGFEKVRDAFVEGQRGDPGGAQLCVYRNGVRVVDLWAGRDVANDRPYEADTLTVLMSCTKGALAVCMSMLAERGLLDLEAPVARYWPEFAAAGKGDITVAHCLSHTAGLPVFQAGSGVGPRDLGDWSKCVQTLAAAAPLWPAGAAASYHAVTYGFLNGEILRRITGQTPGQFFADNVAKPLGLEFWIGLPGHLNARVAPHMPLPAQPGRWAAIMKGAGIDIDHPVMKEILAGFDAIDGAIHFINTPEGRAAEIPAANGIANARALARMYAACIGEVDGVRLISGEAMQRARTSRTKETPPPGPMAALPRPPSEGFGLGFELGNNVVQMLGKGSFGHTGAGGRLGFAHPESGIAVGFACSNMLWDNFSPDPRWLWKAPLREIAGVA